MISMETFIKALRFVVEAVGAVTIILFTLNQFFGEASKLNSWKNKIYGWLARYFQHKKLVQKAISSDIESHVNDVVADLQSELPPGWIKKASIEWVKEPDGAELSDGDIIVRMRPMENQDTNFLNAVHVFFSEAVFPKLKTVIPLNIRESTAIHLACRTIRQKKPFLEEMYKNNYMEIAAQENSAIAGYLGQYENIDSKGFFTSVFLREAGEISDRARFSELRSGLDVELDSVLSHIREFVERIGKQDGDEEIWYREGTATSYAFLLVAQPNAWSVKPYLERAKERVSSGIERLYIFGAARQEDFAKAVISMIAKSPDYELVEVIKLSRDYRGQPGGVGALLVAQKKQK